MNVPAIVGFGKACQIIPSYLNEEMEKTRRLRELFEMEILAILPDAFVIGARAARLPGTSGLCIMDVPADVLLARATSVCISSGSACTSRALKASHVLIAMGISHEIAQGSLLFSFGLDNTGEDVDYVLETLPPIVDRLRQMSPLYSKFLKDKKGGEK